jgi:hypothetical protein
MMQEKSEEIAQWMLSEVIEKGILRQEDVVSHIKSNYGSQYLYVNELGHTSIDKEVKKIYKKLHKGRVAWEREGFFWAWT